MKITTLTLLSAAVLAVTTSASADTVLVQEDFAGAVSSDLNGTSPAIGSGTWTSQSTVFSADGSASFASNSLAYLSLGSLVNDAKGTANGLFKLTVTLDQTSSGGNTWYSIGFGQDAAPLTNNHFLSRNGVASIILRASGELDMWAGNGFTPNGATPTGSSNIIDGPDGTEDPRTLTVELDLRNWNGTTDFGTVTYSDSVLGDIGTFNYTNTPILANTGSLGSAPTDPNFNTIMLSGNAGSAGTYSNLTLTQVPEPGSLALLGLGGLLIVRRRRG